MTYAPLKKLTTLSVLLAGLALTRCGTVDKLKQVGQVPPMTPIQNPVQAETYKPVSMPMPAVQKASYQPNSLWRSGARAFFEDQRAQQIGDILTVNIEVTDSAKVNNTTSRSRSGSEDSGITNLLGLETALGQVFSEDLNPAALAVLGSTSSSNGTGSVDRAEDIDLTVAAVVTQVLPNGNLVIRGSQEMRVNYEVRELAITGIVRPEDIQNDNTINHTQIAEARISYGGRGHISDVQQPRYGQQVVDILMPF